MATMQLQRTTAIRIDDFSGGLNSRDAPDQVQANEAVDAMNVTLDERGGVQPRLGYTALNASPLAGAVKLIFYWQTQQLTIFQVGNTLYKTNDWVTITSFKTFTTTARCALADFLQTLVIVHPVDGVFTYDNTTLTLRDATVKGNTIAVWQNKVWVAGDPALPTRVKWSDPGDATIWSAASFVDIREKDDAIITALGIGQGQDVSGRPGLLVCKQRSSYRINDATTGTYTTIHPSAGAVSAQAIATLDEGAVGVLGPDGLYVTDGVQALENVSGRLDPLFTPAGLNYATMDDWCAGVFQNRLVFSMTRAGGSSNNLTLEYEPHLGWILPHSFGASSWTKYLKQTQKTYMGLPGTTKAYDAFTGGTDDGTSVTSRWQSSWYELNGGAQARARRARVWGRGEFNWQVLFDFKDNPGDEYPFQFVATGVGVWGTGKWNQFIWGPGGYEGAADFYSLGHGTHLSVRFDATTDSSGTGRTILGTGNAIEVGEFAFYGSRLDLVPLGAA